ncbi:MAG TPA: hypothetical protein VFH27_05095 [Longimicrobiaceae bacterium]|nr:hypothetical protein [Longimicrobiaceae bacterium]
MRRMMLTAMLAVAACAHPRSEVGPQVGAGAAGGELVQCAVRVAADRGYSVAPQDAGTDRMRAQRSIPPERGYDASTGVITAQVAYGRGGDARLKVQGQRYVRGVASVQRRGLPGETERSPYPPAVGGTTGNGRGGTRRIPLGQVAADAAAVEDACVVR